MNKKNDTIYGITTNTILESNFLLKFQTFTSAQRISLSKFCPDYRQNVTELTFKYVIHTTAGFVTLFQNKL